MVKCLPEFEYFTVFLKNKNITFKNRRSKVTDYAALIIYVNMLHNQKHFFYFSTKTYLVWTQKNRLIETVLLRTQNIC